MKTTMSIQVDEPKTKMVRIDTKLLYYLKVEAARSKRTIRSLIEECATMVLEQETVDDDR